MGTNAIGAMIVAGSSGFMKSQYRTFNIKDQTLTPGDDYGMMREVLGRRFSRLIRENRATATASVEDGGIVAPTEAGVPDDPDDVPQRPDLILIDGGRGQLEAARSILAELGLPQMFGPDPDPNGVAVVGIAKGPDRNAGRETFFIAGREPFKLVERDPALYFVQRLRDEAHRFAIGTHRARRKKDFVKNPLDEIGGIGPARKRALLHAFGTAKAIGRASLDDLARVPGVNAATAKRIYDFFHEKSG
jgi:excinuclease ABC subunit C